MIFVRRPFLAALVTIGTFLSLAPPPAMAGFNGDAGAGGIVVTLFGRDLSRLTAEYARLLVKPQAHWRYRIAISGCDLEGGPALSGCLLYTSDAADE